MIDFGALFHFTSHIDFFSSYKNGDYGLVLMGNSETSRIVGIGDFWLQTNAGSRLLLKNVRHVPDIQLNLISVGMLHDDGYTSHFFDGKMKLSKGSLLVAKGEKQRTLYSTQARLIKGDTNAIERSSSIELWHKRLGHISKKNLQILARKQLLPDVKGIPLKPCVDCIAGKQHKISFLSSPPHRRKNIFNFVHTNVCSMIKRSLGGAYYFITFIDDHSRKVLDCSLKIKDQVLDMFKEFHARMERQTRRKFKCVRADNDGEYRSPYEKYCRKHGIRLEKMISKTPQQNGIAERMNRTISEKIRSMLSHAKLPKSFWGETLLTAAYLINHSPSNPLNGDITERVWRGRDVSHQHLKEFGHRPFVHIPKDERSKLDGKTKQCIFLSYPSEEFSFRLWDPVARKLIRSRDVIIFENQTIEDIKKLEKCRAPEDVPMNLDPLPSPATEGQGGDIRDDHGNEEAGIDVDGPKPLKLQEEPAPI